mgnify:FL=1
MAREMNVEPNRILHKAAMFAMCMNPPSTARALKLRAGIADRAEELFDLLHKEAPPPFMPPVLLPQPLPPVEIRIRRMNRELTEVRRWLTAHGQQHSEMPAKEELRQKNDTISPTQQKALPARKETQRKRCLRFVQSIKEFDESQEQQRIFEALPSKERLTIHLECEELGLYHAPKERQVIVRKLRPLEEAENETIPGMRQLGSI